MNENLDDYEPVARIIVIGVGGAGSNCVNRMINDNITNVEFYVANTDKQALSLSQAPNRIILGENITNGLGAGGEPSVGKQAAEASIDEIRKVVEGAHLVFITAGMGGGTGTGAAPIIAKCAKDAGCLTVAIVTRPFTFEGNKKTEYSVEGLNELKNCVDSLIVVNNDKLLMNSGKKPFIEAFSEADKVLSTSVKTVTDLIITPAAINLDFADVKATLENSGIALIGFGSSQGENGPEEAAYAAINNPLIEQSIVGATKCICYITCGPKVSLYDAQNCVNYIIEQSGNQLALKFGITIRDDFEDTIMVSVIASGFKGDVDFSVPQRSLESFELNSLRKVQESMEELEKDQKKEKSIEDDFMPNFFNKNF